MLYVAFLTPTEGTLAERTGRRLEWQYPEGIDVLGEYWLQTDSPAVIVAFRTDSYAPMMAIQQAWSDLFDITIIPAVTGEEGMRLVRQMMPK